MPGPRQPRLRQAAPLLSLVFMLGGIPANADSYFLKNGATIDGETIVDAEGEVLVRTAFGQIRLSADMIERVERAPSIFQQYEERRRGVAETAAAQFELAEWCAANDLSAERKRHLLQAVELEPDFEPARRQLGHIRVGQLWVEARAVERPRPAKRSTTIPAPGGDLADNDAKLVRAIQGQWMQRVRAIRINMLESADADLVRSGRAKIQAIDDPLAILALTRELGRSNAVCRSILVERLARFPQDESTLNLAALTLLDAASEVRRAALQQLTTRQDPRVVAQVRKALKSDNDELVKRAAIAAGTLRDASAIPELIERLTAERVRRVEVPVVQFFRDLPGAFGARTLVRVGKQSYSGEMPIVGFLPSGRIEYDRLLASDSSEFRDERVVVYRTEVLEALRRITGEDFGFDDAAWRRWHQEFLAWKDASGVAR